MNNRLLDNTLLIFFEVEKPKKKVRYQEENNKTPAIICPITVSKGLICMMRQNATSSHKALKCPISHLNIQVTYFILKSFLNVLNRKIQRCRLRQLGLSVVYAFLHGRGRTCGITVSICCLFVVMITYRRDNHIFFFSLQSVRCGDVSNIVLHRKQITEVKSKESFIYKGFGVCYVSQLVTHICIIAGDTYMIDIYSLMTYNHSQMTRTSSNILHICFML